MTATLLCQVADIITRHTNHEGDISTMVEGLVLSRRASSSPAIHSSQTPMFGIIVQGKKRIQLGDEVHLYGVGDYLLVSFNVPVISSVIDATQENPLLGLGIEISSEDLHDVLSRITNPANSYFINHSSCVTIAHTSQELLSATLRLVQLLDAPDDIQAIAPLIKQEIIYRLLIGPCGIRLLELANANSPGSRIAKAIEWLRKNYALQLRISELAEHIGMSESSLHHHFKAVARMTPMQYQKQLRLQEARRLIQMERRDIGSAGYKVGYQSRSQFSREYRRLYGLPPYEDARLQSQLLS
ncbi:MULTISPECIES: AraC family transcriptional regulator [Raoultella]|uniref:AraC family transcriptional regulator n=1 Tax=Raoultella TaxID=160674 RepID=UPI002168300E|nr:MULTISPECIES: AraC family transcriptional regulator [Raoultella]MCS4273671.1 AraC-like DNA-binding protein [Raoultella sp. BIGb0132]MCS4290300.1 AraC-like DNA-binding protein [Raoultella terrigena]